eukprot:scaffold7641_cov115-Cylindrotheca_fusiformis.AAC.23
MDDIEDAHRGGKRKEGLLQPEPETPVMPMWQTVFRYTVEILAVLFLSLWASTRQNWSVMMCAVFLILACWRVFNVDDDPATMDRPCLVVPGMVRIVMELVIQALACYCLWDLLENHFEFPAFGAFIFAAAVVLYYIVTMERVKWVLRQ